MSSPAVLIALVSAIIGLIVKAVRLQSKVDKQDDEISELQTEAEKKDAADKLKVKEIELAISESKIAFYKHVADTKAHHNEEAVQEFRTALERRFTNMDKSLEDIARKLNHLAGRE